MAFIKKLIFIGCIFDVFDRLPPNFLQKLASILFPRWYPSTLPCHKITFKHFFSHTETEFNTPEFVLARLASNIKSPLSFFLSLSPFLPLTSVVLVLRLEGEREREKRKRERVRELRLGTPLSFPFPLHSAVMNPPKKDGTDTFFAWCHTHTRTSNARTHPRALTHKHLPNLLQTTMSILTGVCPCLSPPVFFAVFFLFAFLCFVQSCSLRCLAFFNVEFIADKFFSSILCCSTLQTKKWRLFPTFFRRFIATLSSLSSGFCVLMFNEMKGIEHSG